MKRTCLYITRQLLLLVLALQIMNMSVNAIDFTPIASTDIHDFNDLNTFTEYFAEVVFGHINAFPESIHKEQKQTQLQKHITVKLVTNPPAFHVSAGSDLNAGYLSPRNENGTLAYSREINPPPPKA